MWRKTEALYCDFCGDVMEIFDNYKSSGLLVLKSDAWLGEDICHECCNEKEKGEENG